MPLITVVGATNQAFAVTLTGNNANSQISLYKAAMASNSFKGTVGGGVAGSNAGNSVAGGTSPYQTAARFDAVPPTVRSGITTLAIMQPGSSLSSTSYTASSSIVDQNTFARPNNTVLQAEKSQKSSVGGVGATAGNLPGPASYATVPAAAMLPTVSGSVTRSLVNRASVDGAGSSVSAGHASTGTKDSVKSDSVVGSRNIPAVADSTSGITLPGANADGRHPSVSGSGVSVSGSNARDLDHTKADQATVSAALSSSLSGVGRKGDNFTLDTSTGAVTGGWKDTISAVGPGRIHGHMDAASATSSQISVGGPLSFIGGTIHPAGGSVAGDGLASSTVAAGNATIFSGSHDLTSRYLNSLNTSNTRDHALSSFTFDTSSTHKTLGVPSVAGSDTLKGANASSSDNLSHYLRADSLRGGVGHAASDMVSKKDLLSVVKASDLQHMIADFGRSAGKKAEHHKPHRVHFDQFSAHNHQKGAVHLNDGTQIQFNDAAAANNLLGDDLFKS